MFRLVADIHFSDIGSLYWEKLQRHAPFRILRMIVDGGSLMFSFASWLIYVSIGCRHLFIKYWQPLLAKSTAKCSLPPPENERQWSVNSFSCCIVGNQVMVLIFALTMELLTAIIGKKYNIPKLKHQFQINLYQKLQSIQKHIIGCWKRYFDMILLTNSKNKSLIWIYRWTRWLVLATVPDRHFGSRSGSKPNLCQIGGPGRQLTQTAHLGTIPW